MEQKTMSSRDLAINWLNKSREFNSGIALLEQNKFKTAVVAELKKEPTADGAQKKITTLIRELIQHLNNPNAEVHDTDAEKGIVDGNNINSQTQASPEKELLIVQAADKLKKEGDDYLPKDVAKLVRYYADLYKKREMLHRELSENEDNEPETIGRRASISDSIARCTEQMEKLYPLYEKYTADKTEPTEEELAAATQSEEKEEQEEQEEKEPVDYSTLSKEELQSLKKSLKTKILRANNTLLYQQETKAEKENPMPDCPKRVKLEKKIERLSVEVEKLEYAIAEKG